MCDRSIELAVTELSRMASGGLFEISELSVEELAEFLRENGVSNEITKNFVQNRVSGKAFEQLTLDDIKELVPIIGYRTQIRDILHTYRKVR